jgi:hypothetical protein
MKTVSSSICLLSFAIIGCLLPSEGKADPQVTVPQRSPDQINWTVNDRFRFVKPCPPEALSRQQCRFGDLAAEGGVFETLAANLNDAGADVEANRYEAIAKLLVFDRTGVLENKPADGTIYWNTAFGTGDRRLARNGSERSFEPNYLYPASYVVTAFAPIGKTGTCIWSVDGTKRAEQPCDRGFELSLPADPSRPSEYGSIAANLSVSAIGSTEIAAQSTVRVRDYLIVSMGDSYASGEGNPDRASFIPTAAFAGQERNPNWFSSAHRVAGFKPAEWLDTPCHRSLLSSHAIASLAFSAENPRVAVTYVPLACSGAHIFNGILRPQELAPGQTGGLLGLLFKPNTEKESQLSQLEILRCAIDPEKLRQEDLNPIQNNTRVDDALRTRGRKVPLKICDSERKRAVDRALLSIGGNDVGFAGGVSWALLPEEGNSFFSNFSAQLANSMQTVCPEVRDNIPETRCRSGGSLIAGKFPDLKNVEPLERIPKDVDFDPLTRTFPTTGGPYSCSDSGQFKVVEAYIYCLLPNLYRELDTQLIAAGMQRQQVTLVGYPNPTRTSHERAGSCPGPTLGKFAADRDTLDFSKLESLRRRNDGMENRYAYTPGFQAMRGFMESLLPFSGTKRRMQVLAGESEVLERTMIKPLARLQANLSFDDPDNEAGQWKRVLITGPFDAVTALHGWCATGAGKDGNEAAAELLNGAWTAHGIPLPSELKPYDGYAFTNRWTRTANDSVMTQLRRGYAIQGTVHPNLVGQIFVAKQIRNDLAGLVEEK